MTPETIPQDPAHLGRGHVLLVDDDADHNTAAADWLESCGFTVTAFLSAEPALAVLHAGTADVLLTDLRMPGLDGFALLTRARAEDPALPVIVMTGHGDVPQAVRAMRAGAEDFLEKPYHAEHLVAVLDRAIAGGRARRELGRLRATIAAGPDTILGQSPAAEALRTEITRLGPLDLAVLILGETGAGKERAARALHAESPRAAGPFIALNCAAIPEMLFEIEAFGHAGGAFPGAGPARAGRLEQAAGGTLFLDEIASMPPGIQAKLLRVLEERVVTRLGEDEPRPLDLRLLAASSPDPAAAQAEGRLRPDLYFRLAEVQLVVPPLRARPGDAVLLFSHFLHLAAQRSGRAAPHLPAEALATLETRFWPGNIRELKALAERVALGLETLDGSENLESGSGLAERVAAFEKREIRAALARVDGSIGRAAQMLDLPRRTLADKMARYNL